LEGENEHHKIEAIFKAFGLALRMAMEKNPRTREAIWVVVGNFSKTNLQKLKADLKKEKTVKSVRF